MGADSADAQLSVSHATSLPTLCRCDTGSFDDTFESSELVTVSAKLLVVPSPSIHSSYCCLDFFSDTHVQSDLSYHSRNTHLPFYSVEASCSLFACMLRSFLWSCYLGLQRQFSSLLHHLQNMLCLLTASLAGVRVFVGLGPRCSTHSENF